MPLMLVSGVRDCVKAWRRSVVGVDSASVKYRPVETLWPPALLAVQVVRCLPSVPKESTLNVRPVKAPVAPPLLTSCEAIVPPKVSAS